MRQCAVIIPSLDPTEDLVSYVQQLVSRGIARIIVINDGSKEECTPIFNELSTIDQVDVLIHPHNMGKGRALKTAFTHYLRQDDQLIGVITADSDGQHSVDDVCKLADELVTRNQELILGVRNFKEANVPSRSLFGNRVTCFAFRLLFNRELQDTQTGLRAIPNSLLRNMVTLKGDKYEYEINMLIYAVKHHIYIHEMSIQTLYYNNNEGSHYKALRDSAKIFSRLISGFVNKHSLHEKDGAQ